MKHLLIISYYLFKAILAMTFPFKFSILNGYKIRQFYNTLQALSKLISEDIDFFGASKSYILNNQPVTNKQGERRIQIGEKKRKDSFDKLSTKLSIGNNA